MRTSSRIDNVNVRPNVNNDINVNVNVRPNFAVWTMKRSSTFANEDSSSSRCGSRRDYQAGIDYDGVNMRLAGVYLATVMSVERQSKEGIARL